MIKSCATCKHWLGGLSCAAYLDGIPWPIQAGEIAHDEPLPDDGGLQWEPREDAAKFDDGGEADTEQPPFGMTDGIATRDQWAAIKAMVLQLSPDDDDAEEALRQAVEAQGEKAILRAFRAQWRNLLPPNAESMELHELMAYINSRLIEAQVPRDAITRVVLNAADIGVNIALDQLGTLGMGFDYAAVNTRARAWGAQYAGELITNIDATTRQGVQQAVERWYTNREPIAALRRDLEPLFGARRAKLIAQTETTRAAAASTRLSYIESGVVARMRWRTVFDERVCPTCGALDGTEVNLDGRFSDVLSAELQQSNRPFELPPAHPGCRCRLVAVIKGD